MVLCFCSGGSIDGRWRALIGSLVVEQVSRVRRAHSEEEAKAILKTAIRESFFPELQGFRGFVQTGDEAAERTHQASRHRKAPSLPNSLVPPPKAMCAPARAC